MKKTKDLTTEEIVKQLADEQKKVHGFDFSKNFSLAVIPLKSTADFL